MFVFCAAMGDCRACTDAFNTLVNFDGANGANVHYLRLLADGFSIASITTSFGTFLPSACALL